MKSAGVTPQRYVCSQEQQTLTDHAECDANAKCRHKVQQNGKRLPDPIVTDGKAIF